MRLLITELVTLAVVVSFGIAVLRKLGLMHRHFNARLDGLARGISAVQDIATGLVRAAAVHESGRDSRVGPSGSSAPSSAPPRTISGEIE